MHICMPFFCAIWPPVKTKAFTLVEIMIAVLIIGLLAALAFPMYTKVRLNTIRSVAKSDARKVTAAANQYCAEKGATSVPVSNLIGAGCYVSALSRGNSINVSSMLMSSTFTFEITNPFLTAGGLTFDNEGLLIGDPY